MNRRTLPLPLVLAAAVGLDPSSLGAAPADFVLRDTTYRVGSATGPDSLLVRDVTFTSRVLGADVDSSTSTLVVSLGPDHSPDENEDSRSLVKENLWNNWVLVYDLRDRRVIWTERGKALPVTTAPRRAFLQRSEERSDVIRLPDGRKLAELSGRTFLWADGVCLRVTDGAVSLWDPEGATDRWTADRTVGGQVDDVVRQDSIVYVIGEGLQKLDLRKGAAWSHVARSSRSGIYHLPGRAGTVQMPSMFGGNRAIAMTARPLILGRDIYFAADTTVARLDSRSGLVRWRQHLRVRHGFSLRQRALGLPLAPSFLGRLLVRDAGERILVASLGWAEGPKTTWLADPPSVALLAKEDGRTLARFQVPGVEVLYDAWSTRHGHYLIAHDRLLAMDERLNVRATFRAPLELQPLVGFLEVGDRVVVATASGVAAFSADSLELVWSHPCGRLLAAERLPDWAGTRYAVTTQGLLRLDEGTGHRPTAYYPMRGAWAVFRENGVMIGAGRTLRLVVLPVSRELGRVD